MEHVLLDGKVRLIQANALSIPLEDGSVNCCVTSPPYWGLRDYLGNEDQLGQEKTPDEYVANMVAVFREVRRVLRADGTLWLNIGDSYAAQRGGTHMPAETLAGGKNGKTDEGECVNRGRSDGYSPSRNASAIGLKHKDLVGIPWMVAFALRADGWYLRQDIIYAKVNPMPESVTDRCTKAHEYLFLLSKSPRYYYDQDAIKEPSVSGDLRKPYAPGQVDARGNGHDRGGGTFRKTDKQSMVGKRTYTGFNDRWDGREETDPLKFRNKRDVWSVATHPYKEAHFATFPPKLIEPCVLAGCPENGLVLDPFGGSGTTARVCVDNNRRAVLLDINYKEEEGSYLEMAKRRILSPAKQPKPAKKEKVDNWPSLLDFCEVQ